MWLKIAQFPSDKEIGDKKKALQQAVADYCAQVSMDSSYNKSLTILYDCFPPDKALPAVSIFGGSYPDNKYHIYNPYTDGINCPAEFKAYTWFQYN